MADLEIQVQVVAYPDRKNLVLRFVDPNTGRQKTRSAKTTDLKIAERAAAVWEAELREGRYQSPSKITWAEFRERYENEVLPGLAKGTDEKVQSTFNLVERILAPDRLRSVTSERISYFQAELRKARAEDTIASYLAHLKAALNWAVRIGLLHSAPSIQRPRRAKGSKVMKGRPITTEEFERMLAKVPEKAQAGKADDWKYLLNGLWLSGLRLGEAIVLSWDDSSQLRIDLSGKYPMLRIPAELEKGNKDRVLPIVPDFAEFLTATPEEERVGFVFNLPRRHLVVQSLRNWTGRIISAIGKSANVKVHTQPRTKKVKYASAHDLRRSFGERWALRVMPHVLKELMRHETIETTMRYYVGRNADTIAETLWATDLGNAGKNLGNISGNIRPFRQSSN